MIRTVRTVAGVLAAAMVLAAGGSVALAEQINPPNPAAQAGLRIGTVQSSPAPTATTVWVTIFDGGEAQEFPYLSPYVPVAGDQVEVLLLGGGSKSGIVLGGRAGQSGNLVVNGNFYRAPALDLPPTNNPPYHWTRYVASGNAGLISAAPHTSFQRIHMLMFAQTGVSSGDTYAYSSPFPVVADRTYDVRALAYVTTAVNTSLTAATSVAWFGDPNAVYPYCMSESAVGSDALGASATLNLYHSATVTAPTGATWARVALRTNHVGTNVGSASSAYWSEVLVLPE